ncbi:MAG: hypothetical protein JJ964_05770 [Rhizobiales bacterium]|nr:hypothetical protein [Hyphomicrobiales bacterium]
METSIDTPLEKQEREKQHGHFLSGKKLLTQFRTWRDVKQLERGHQKEYWRYYHGDHWTEDELDTLRQRNQPPTYYNEIRRKVNGVVGTEEQMRRDPKAFGRNPNMDDENAANVATKSIRFTCDNNRMAWQAAEVLRNGIVAGISGIRYDIDEDNEEISFDVVDEAHTFYDPRSKKTDFSDAKFLGICHWVDKNDAKALLSSDNEKIEQIFDAFKGMNFSEAPDEVDKGPESWVNTEEDTVFLIEHWYKNNGVWHCAFHCAGVVLEEWVSPLKDEKGDSTHMFELWSPCIKKDGTRYGPVKDMLPIQDAINKRASKLLHMLNTRQTKARAGAITDVDAMKIELHRPDGHIEVNDDFEILSNTDQISGQAQIMQFELSQMDRSGPNNALIGRGTESQSGVAIQEQKSSGITELSWDMQQFRDWRLRCYRKIFNCQKQYWTKERFIRVTDINGAAEFIGLNQPEVNEHGLPALDELGQPILKNNVAELDVDIILDEGPDTLTVQQEDFRILGELMPFLKENGQQIPAKVLFRASPIRNKQEIIDALEQQDKENALKGPDPIAMKQMQLAQAEMQAKIEEIASQIELNQAKAVREYKQAEKIDFERDAKEFEIQREIQQEQRQFLDPLDGAVIDPRSFEGIEYQ